MYVVCPEANKKNNNNMLWYAIPMVQVLNKNHTNRILLYSTLYDPLYKYIYKYNV